MKLTTAGIRTLAESQGLKVFPTWPGTKKPVPIHGFESTPEEIAAAFERVKGQEYGLAISAGSDSGGVIGLDLETQQVAEQLFPSLEVLSKTWCLRTPHGGIVVLVRCLDNVPTRRIRPAGPEHEFDICGTGGYFLIAGKLDHSKCDPAKTRCPHSGTTAYETISWACQIMEKAGFEESLQKRFAELGWRINSRTWPKVNEIAKGVPEGNRNKAAFTMACFLRHQLGMDQHDALHALRVWNERNQPPLPDDELRRIVSGVWSYSGRKDSVIRIPGGRF